MDTCVDDGSPEDQMQLDQPQDTWMAEPRDPELTHAMPTEQANAEIAPYRTLADADGRPLSAEELADCERVENMTVAEQMDEDTEGWPIIQQIAQTNEELGSALSINTRGPTGAGDEEYMLFINFIADHLPADFGTSTSTAPTNDIMELFEIFKANEQRKMQVDDLAGTLRDLAIADNPKLRSLQANAGKAPQHELHGTQIDDGLLCETLSKMSMNQQTPFLEGLDQPFDVEAAQNEAFQALGFLDDAVQFRAAYDSRR